MIPKQIHFIWIGDQSKMPAKCMQTWIDKNPDYKVNIWDNDSLNRHKWVNRIKIDEMLQKQDFAGASDVMRYEILYNEGGIYIDADSYCVKPLEDWLLNCEAFTAWEQEIVRNNLLSNGFIGGVEGATVWKKCIDRVGTVDCTQKELAWILTGPMLLTQVYFEQRPDLTVYPSHYFMPEHHTGYKTTVTGNIFANHLWGSEIGYDTMDAEMEKRK